MDDPTNITGMVDILVGENPEIDGDKIEKSLINDNDFELEDDTPADFAKEYIKDMNKMTGDLGLDMSGSFDPVNNINMPNETMISTSLDSITDMDLPPIGNSAPSFDEPDEPRYKPSNDREERRGGSNWTTDNLDDGLYNRTDEHRKRRAIENVMTGIDSNPDDNHYIDDRDNEDIKAVSLEQIELLRANLEESGVNLDKVPEVDSNSSLSEIQSALKRLQLKNDSTRYCDMFNEGILALSYGLESIFDGKRQWMGNKIDLTGWSQTVKMKLKKMRWNTSCYVSGFMRGHEFSHGWRILAELLPSLFLYSRQRRLHTEERDNIVYNADYRNAVQNLTD